MELAEQVEPPVPIARACQALGVSRATLYRHTSPPAPRVPGVPRETRPVPRRLDDGERAAIVEVLHSPEFVDQPPHEVYAALLTRGIYLASVRTMYRVLAELGESHERRAQRSAVRHVKPTLEATAPNQVWTWDITKLAGPAPGIFYCLYVIIDLFSRYVVGWLLADSENTVLAKQLFAETLLRHGIEPGHLTVHSDRGSPMKSDGLAQLLGVLGVTRSFSRPRVSDDNPFSEAQFKTLKYQPDFPDRFDSPQHARAYCQAFFGWHNDEHHHSGLALFTPADVFHGRVPDVAARRQSALDGAYAAHPERFPHGAPRVPLPPNVVSINPLHASSGTSIVDGSCHSAPHDHPPTDNVDGRHGARHGVMSGSDRIIMEASPKSPAEPTLLAAHHPAAEPFSRTGSALPS
jgi:transposase InsO family protein